MTNLHHPKAKEDEMTCFEVKLDWLTNRQGLLSARHVSETIQVSSPPKFGGEGNEWTPEHLFLASISSCFMSTYLALARKYNFSILDFMCKAEGQIGLVAGKYQFTHINVFPKIYVADESLMAVAIKACRKSEEYCLVSSAVSIALHYHYEVVIGEKPQLSTAETVKDFYAKL